MQAEKPLWLQSNGSSKVVLSSENAISIHTSNVQAVMMTPGISLKQVKLQEVQQQHSQLQDLL